MPKGYVKVCAVLRCGAQVIYAHCIKERLKAVDVSLLIRLLEAVQQIVGRSDKVGLWETSSSLHQHLIALDQITAGAVIVLPFHQGHGHILPGLSIGRTHCQISLT